MPHFVERKDKGCLNCGAIVYGRYCHICGQENIEPKETFWHLITHFAYDVTHFDGKFFSSVKYLLFKPGFLSKEYVRGKRMSYLNPIRMYVFISAFFFLFFFSVVIPHFNIAAEKSKTGSYKEVKAKITARIGTLQKEMKGKDTSGIEAQTLQHRVALLQQDLQKISKDTTHLDSLNYYDNVVITVDKNYTSLSAYDSIQRTLPDNYRDSWIKKMFARKSLGIKAKYQNKGDQFSENLFEKCKHVFPQMFFVSLPLFALLLKLLYVRRKNFFYVDHVIYSVHLYCAMFILMFVLMSLSQLLDFHYLHWLHDVSDLLWIYVPWYIYRSMKVFYNQGIGKTILKFFLLLILSSVFMTFLFAVFFILSVFSI